MRSLLGDELFSLQGHWFHFSLNEHPGPYTFPKPSRWSSRGAPKQASRGRFKIFQR
jgi:hypothetical protein